MLGDVLRYIEAHGGAPVTAVRQAFGLPAELAAHLCIQLQDAGFLSEWELEPCHHQDADTSCEQCSGGSCAGEGSHGHAAPVGPTADEFKQGCCGMNAPLHVTPRGRAYLVAVTSA